MPVSFHPIHRVAGGGLVLLILVVLTRGHSMHWARTPPARGGTDAGVLLKSERLLMGTSFTISIWAPSGRETAAAETLGDVFDRLAALEQTISSWIPTSETCAANRAAGGDAVPVEGDLQELLVASLDWAQRTDGAFDITGGPLFELWEEARTQGVLPTGDQVRQRLQLVGYRNIELDHRTVRLARRGMKIGFGAIGKGFAADRAADLLRHRGFHDFIIDSGGDMMVSGRRGDAPWTVAIRHPRRDAFLATVLGTDHAIATSGDYERYFVVDGTRYSHILDLRTGWPARNVASTTVIARRATDADAVATACCTMDPDERMKLVESLPGVEALFVDRAGGIRLSSGLHLEDGSLELVR